MTALIGQGGMGRVYLAEHPSMHRKVAIKVLHPWLACQIGVVRRFLGEARAAATIRHPNIVEVIDSGTLDDGTPYILMEYLEGEPLSMRIQQPLPMRAVVDIAMQTASGLAAAHNQGVIHRDLKPDNLFLIPDPRRPGQELVKILDFGIAKLLDAAAAQRTETGILVGTPLYMSPEQCMGTGRIDGRSDIYSLGVILYQMLCGRPPFRSRGTGALVLAHASAPLPPPRRRNPCIPSSLEKIITRMLAKNPAARFQTMDAVRIQLAIALSEARQNWPDSLTPGPVPIQEREDEVPLPAAPSRRRGLGLVLALTAAAAFLLGSDLAKRSLAPTALEPKVTATRMLPMAAAIRVPTVVTPIEAAPTAAPRASERVTVVLSSIPRGARVAMNGTPVGVTPMQYSMPRSEEPVAFVFSRSGHSSTTVRALPAANLRVIARLHRRGSRSQGNMPSFDIKTER